jgi:hypothetical protein
MLFNSGFAHPAVMIRKSVLDENKLFYNTEFEKAEDYRMWYDVMKVSKGHNLQEPLLRYRHHQNQVTKTNVKEQTTAVTKMRKVMYDTLNLGTEEYLEVFSKICNGVRTFDEAEYKKARSWMKKSLKNNNGYDKKALKRHCRCYHYSMIKINLECAFNHFIAMLKGE